MGKMGEWMHADFQYEYFNDRSFFEKKSYQAVEGWKGFGKAAWNDPLGMVVPGVIEAWRNPTSPGAWGKAAVDIGLMGLSVAKIGRAATDFLPKCSDVLLSSSRQIQSKFKHAADFGISGTYSKANAFKFNSTINQHINKTGVQAISGTYRGDPVIHYLDPKTGLNIISSPWRIY